MVFIMNLGPSLLDYIPSPIGAVKFLLDWLKEPKKYEAIDVALEPATYVDYDVLEKAQVHNPMFKGLNEVDLQAFDLKDIKRLLTEEPYSSNERVQNVVAKWIHESNQAELIKAVTTALKEKQPDHETLDEVISPSNSKNDDIKKNKLFLQKLSAIGFRDFDALTQNLAEFSDAVIIELAPYLSDLKPLYNFAIFELERPTHLELKEYIFNLPGMSALLLAHLNEHPFSYNTLNFLSRTIKDEKFSQLLREALGFYTFFTKEHFHYRNNFMISPYYKYESGIFDAYLNKCSAENKKIFLNWPLMEPNYLDSLKGHKTVAYSALTFGLEEIFLVLLKHGAFPRELENQEVDEKFKKIFYSALIRLNHPLVLEAARTKQDVFELVLENCKSSDIRLAVKSKEIIMDNLIAGHYRAFTEQEGENGIGNVKMRTQDFVASADMARRNQELTLLYANELKQGDMLSQFANFLSNVDGHADESLCGDSVEKLLFQALQQIKTLKQEKSQSLQIMQELKEENAHAKEKNAFLQDKVFKAAMRQHQK